MADFEKLAVWRIAHEICLDAYHLAQTLPPEEKYGIKQQITRAAYSVPSNIVEGNERSAPGDFAHFIDIALGSAAELRYFLILTRDLNYLTSPQTSELSSKLAGLSRMLREFREAGHQVRISA